MSKRRKLCYVIPQYELGAHTHFAYLIPFIRKLTKNFDIWLIVERGTFPPDMGAHCISLGESQIPIIRFMRVKYFLFRAYLSGYRDFYVHYSFFSAFVASSIVRVFGGRVFYWNCGEPWKYERNFFRDQFERMTYRFITYLVTGTEGMKRAYAEHYHIPHQKIKIMPNWIEVENMQSTASNFQGKKEKIREELRIAKDQKVILFVHRLSKRKGAHYLPSILKGLQNKNTVLIIVGDGPEKGLIESQMMSLRLQDKVRFLGWVPQEKVGRYFAIADVFILPSEEEGLPHVILESMAYGVPYVAFDVGGVREVTSPKLQAYIFPQKNTAGFIKGVDALLALKSVEIKKIKLEMETWVKRYDSHISIDLFTELFLTKKIKILFFTNDLGLGGVQRLTVDFANALNKKEFDVTIGTLFSRPDSFFYQENIKKGIRFIPFSFSSWHDIRSFFVFYIWLRREKFDIVFTQLFMADAIGRVGAFFARVPVIVTEIQNIIPHLSKKYILIDRLLRHITDVCISTTSAVTSYAEDVIGFPSKKIVLVPTNAVDEQRFAVKSSRATIRQALGVPREAKIILNIGRLVEQKGQRMLINAMPAILKVEPNAHLLIAGSGKLENEFMQLIKTLGLEDHIQLLGNRRDTPELLMSSDVFAFPSMWEGQGLILFEAFFSKIPIIASRIGGIPDVIQDGETGLLIEVGDSDALVAGIIRILEDGKLRKHMTTEALRRYGDRTITQSVHKLEAVFKSQIHVT